MLALVHLCINQHSTPTPKIWLGAKFTKTGHVTLTTSIRG